MGLQVAVLGATGLVGRTMLELLEKRNFPAECVRVLASERSAGSTLTFRGVELTVEAAVPQSFEGVDLVLSSAGGSVSQQLLPAAAACGAICIDNTSAFRMDDDVPLVVPEVNGHRALEPLPRRIISNPNCSTIQLVMVLKPLHDAFGVNRVHVASYQSVSGAGSRALQELHEETNAVLAGRDYERRVFPHSIAFNVLPHIDVFLSDGDSKEEWKLRFETKKILEAPVGVHATCVRVPVRYGHSEAVWIETREKISPETAREALKAAPGVVVLDDSAKHLYPTPQLAAGNDAVYVGRIRSDPTCQNGLALWIVSDNIRKGAALNAIQIAELILDRFH